MRFMFSYAACKMSAQTKASQTQNEEQNLSLWRLPGHAGRETLLFLGLGYVPLYRERCRCFVATICAAI